jgi:hypothetical protein
MLVKVSPDLQHAWKSVDGCELLASRPRRHICLGLYLYVLVTFQMLAITEIQFYLYLIFIKFDLKGGSRFLA